MSGGIVFRTGGPLGWLGERQDRTALSSCVAELRATNATSKKVVDFRHLVTSMWESGHHLPDATQPTLLYNDNDACVKWSHNMTSKAARHIELREKFDSRMDSGQISRRQACLWQNQPCGYIYQRDA